MDGISPPFSVLLDVMVVVIVAVTVYGFAGQRPSMLLSPHTPCLFNQMKPIPNAIIACLVTKRQKDGFYYVEQKNNI